MSTDKEIKELEKHWRQSRRAIPISVGMLVAAAVVLWLLISSFPIPLWVAAIVLGLTAFTLIGDIINCCHCARKLRRVRPTVTSTATRTGLCGSKERNEDQAPGIGSGR